ncbi:hypothetical protein [Leptothermofonsia sp. ETS-13]
MFNATDQGFEETGDRRQEAGGRSREPEVRFILALASSIKASAVKIV